MLEDELKYDGVVLLSYEIAYPAFYSACFRRCLPRLNAYYRNRALEYRRYCHNELFDMAVEQYKDAIENNFPVREFEVVQAFDVTYMEDCVVSLYIDQYEYTGGAHGNTLRRSQTWNLQKCGLIDLSDIVTCEPDYRAYILAEVEKQIEKEPDIYFDDYKELIVKTFDEDSFYCTPEGVVVYYQQYDIAPYSSGIREFLIPYGGCVKDPAVMCV